MNHSNITVASLHEAEILLNNLRIEGQKGYEQQPILNHYITSLLIIIVIHFVFIYQWINGLTRKDVIFSYNQIVIQKKFFKIMVGLLSHPFPDMMEGHHQTFDMLPSDDNGSNQVNHFSSNQMFSFHACRRFMTKVKTTLIPFLSNHPFTNNLPLLIYTSHIIWQVRPLEEIFDIEYDQDDYESMHNHPNFNITTVLESEKIIQKSMAGNDVLLAGKGQPHGPFRYHQVCATLLFTSVLIDLLLTRIALHYIWRFRAIPRPRRIQKTISDRGLCTLVPLCTALLVLYGSYFPYTSISIIPFLRISLPKKATTLFGFQSSSVIGFIIPYSIIGILSYKAYPVCGTLYGTFSGLLWLNGVTTFLATPFWGVCCYGSVGIACIFSYKSEYIRLKRLGRTSSQIDWLPCIDNVEWDSNKKNVRFSLVESRERERT